MRNDEKKLKNYHRLANAALTTLATILAVLFGYVLTSTQLNPETKTNITGIWLLIFSGIIASGISLLCGEKVIPVAKWGAICGIIIMFATIAVMILFLSAIMYSMP